MNTALNPRAKSLLEAFDRDSALRGRTGSAAGLYRHLLTKASAFGLAMWREDALLDDTGLSSAEFDRQVQALAKAGLIELLSPAPFLAIKITLWPGNGGKRMDSASSGHSYSFQPTAIENSYSTTDSHGNRSLLRDILVELGEVDADAFRPVLDHYSEPIIREALDRVRQAGTIHKSKTALFRFLLTKLSKPRL